MFGLTIGYSRVFLGVHTWNQLLFGWQLGIWLALTLHFCFKDSLMRNLESLYDQSEKNLLKMTLRWFSLLAVVVLVEVVNFVVLDSQIVNDPLWAEQITIKCPSENLAHAFEAKSMLDNGIIGIGFGAYLGVIYHAKHHPGLLTKRLSHETITRQVLRIFLGIALCLPFLCLMMLKAEQIANVYVLSLLKTFSPTFISGFIVFGPFDDVAQRVNLLTFGEQEHDYQKSLLMGVNGESYSDEERNRND